MNLPINRLDVVDIWKSYEGKPLLQGITLSVDAGETVCLLGPSGGGKSTLLRIIAGLETAEKGIVYWQGKDLSSLPVHARNFGLMFQEYALFPHRNVAQNIAFGLRMQGKDATQINPRVMELLKQVNMQSFANRRVTDLSGGEQQRVALARTLAPDPQLLMLDEPLGALDRTLSDQLAADLRHLLQSTGIPAVYVTHDQQEAFTIADRILLMHEGRIVQEGTPQQVYAYPNSRWAAEFLGLKNILTGTLASTNPVRVRTGLGELFAREPDFYTSLGAEVLVLLRSSEVSLTPLPGFDNVLHGTVEDCVFMGENYRLDVQLAGRLRFQFMVSARAKPGEQITLYLPVSAVNCLPG